MRGSPPLHLVIFLLVFAALAVPLSKLTFARPALVVAAQAKESTSATAALIRLRFAHTPQSVSLKHDSVELLPPSSTGRPASSIEARTSLRLSPEGIELMLTATWPQGTPDTAVTVELEPDGLDAQSQTRWSDSGTLGEALTYQWKP